MNLQQLYYFQKIAELRNYTKASEALMISQSNLSHSMANLEEELGIPLFIKKGRNIDITDYGRAFLRHVSIIINELEKAKSEISSALNPDSGQIRLAIAHTLGHHFIPNMIRYYKGLPENKNVTFELHEMEATSDGMNQIINGEIDLGFGAKLERPGFHYFEIMHEEYIAIVPEGHPLASKENLTIEEICQEPFVTYNQQCGTRHDLERIFQKNNVHPKVIYEATNEKMIASMVASGMGISIMPRIQEISIYPVVPITIENHALRRSLYMFWNENIFQPPIVAQFRKFVMETLRI